MTGTAAIIAMACVCILAAGLLLLICNGGGNDAP